jgi:hypothetical protein
MVPFRCGSIDAIGISYVVEGEDMRTVVPGQRVCAKNEKIESTVRYLGVEVDEALLIAEQVDV